MCCRLTALCRRRRASAGPRFLEMLVNPCLKVGIVLKSARLRAEHLLRLMFRGMGVAQPVEQVFVRIGHHGPFSVRENWPSIVAAVTSFGRCQDLRL
jgi:hypothetical protein